MLGNDCTPDTQGQRNRGRLNEGTLMLIIILRETTESVFTASESPICLLLEADALLKLNAMCMKHSLWAY